jgi:excisionase family DNA binding protein
MIDSPSNRARQLKRALDNLRKALDEFESAMVEFEEELAGEQQHVRPQSGRGLDLLSIPELCQELGMGKSWVYQRIRSGEIPSVKLGRNIKVRRQDLEAYLQSQAYRPQEDEELLPEEGEDQPLS